MRRSRRKMIRQLIRPCSIVAVVAAMVVVAFGPVVAARGQETSSAAAPGAASGVSSPGATPDLSSPRATVASFFNGMSAVKAGNEGRVPEVYACLDVGVGLSDGERLDRTARFAVRLFAILDRLQFRLDDIPGEVEERQCAVRLPAGNTAVILMLDQDADGSWRFGPRMLNDDVFDAIEAELDAALEVAEPDEDALPFDPRLRSPRAALGWFLRAMDAADGLEPADAIDVLDLSGVPPGIRAQIGTEYAAQLKAVIDRYKYVEINELPPESERPGYVFLQDSAGSIVLKIVEDPEAGTRAWKFTKGTLDTLDSLYMEYRGRPIATGLEGIRADMPLTLRIRDWCQDHAPLLLARTLYLQNWQWLGLFVVILVGMVVSRFAAFAFVLLARRWLRSTKRGAGSTLERRFARPIRIALMAWFWLLGLTLLGLPPRALEFLHNVALVITAVGVVWALYRMVDIIGEHLAARAEGTEVRFDDLMVAIVTRSLKVFVIAAGVVVVARQAGQDPTAVLTGLGLGGLAVALAAKDVVANIFGSFTILLDRPFQIGDWVTIGDIDGTVESVGVRSTRIRTFYNSQITVPNGELLNQAIDNMGARRYRRIKTMISIGYATPPATVEAFCEGIRELIRAHPYTRKDYFHVYLNQFGDSSLEILLYCFVETPDWGTELRERHRLFLDIMRLAGDLGVEFAYPTQTLYLRRDEAPTGRVAADADAANDLGRREARRIVRRGLRPGEVPPPVQFDPTVPDMAWSDDDDGGGGDAADGPSGGV